MRSDLVQFVSCLTVIVLGGTLEESLPKLAGIGFPVLMSIAVCRAGNGPVTFVVLVALAAGAFEDALSSLPLMASPCFFLVVAALVHRFRLPGAVLVMAYPLYQAWLELVVTGLPGSLGIRILAAVPIAAVTVFVMGRVLNWIERKVVADEA